MKHVFMWLYGPLETDARVQRSIDAVLKKNYQLTIITSNTSKSFSTNGLYLLKDIPTKNGMVYYFYFVIQSLWFFFRNYKKYNIVYLQDYYSTFPGWILSFFVKKEKLIYDAHELLVNPRRFSLSRREKFFIWFEKQLVKKVKWVVAANRERETFLRRLYKLTNTTSVMNISKYYKTDKARELNVSNIIIVYQGAITESRNLSFFIDAIKKLPSNIKLLFIGDGPSLTLYKERVSDLNLNNRVTFTGRLSNSQMMEKLTTCSIGIVSYSFNGLNNIYCSPNKIFEYASISLPFISTKQPFIDVITKQYNIGETFVIGDLDSFVSNVMMIINHYQAYTKNMNVFLEDFSYEKEMQKLIDIL